MYRIYGDFPHRGGLWRRALLTCIYSAVEVGRAEAGRAPNQRGAPGPAGRGRLRSDGRGRAVGTGVAGEDGVCPGRNEGQIRPDWRKLSTNDTTRGPYRQILSRIDIIEIVGGFVKLKKRGVNYLGFVLFIMRNRLRLTVSPVKEIYKCFGCGRSGNTISFLMEHEKYSYAEALRWLAARYNVEIEEKEVSPEVRQQQQVAESLYIINGFAQKFFPRPVQLRRGAGHRSQLSDGTGV